VVLRLVERHSTQRIVAFSQYATTVTALSWLLGSLPGVAIVTGDSARIASGPLARDEVLAQFAGDARPEPEAMRIRLLLATDLLSEGVDLRGAGVIVNLDLPWNPARLEQRIGRARRIGSRRDRIFVYSLLPPAAAERMLELRRRLSSKVAAANAVVGKAANPFDDAQEPDASEVGRLESLRSLLAEWLAPERRVGDVSPLVATAVSATRGWLALLTIDGTATLVQSAEGLVSASGEDLCRTIRSIRPAAEGDPMLEIAARAEIDAWLRAQVVAADLLDRDDSAARRSLLDRLSKTVARAPRHSRGAVIASARRARAALAHAGGVGAEQAMQELARSTADDESWIRAVEAFGAAQIKRRSDTPSLRALILLVTQPPG
jgi:hypothetical protein